MTIVSPIAVAALLALSSAQADSRDEIVAANARWTEAVARKDMAALEAILGPEFELTGGAATAAESLPRSAWLANLPRLQFSNYNAEITDLSVNGNIAAATVKGSWVLTMGDRSETDRFVLRDIWVRRPQGWQVVRRYRLGN